MMRTRTVPRVVPLVNHIAKPLVAAGLPMGPNGMLTVRGRTSGEPRSTPLAIIEVGGRRWIWSPWGDVNWVRNLRAAGEATIQIHRRQLEVRAVELDPEQRVVFFRETFAPYARRIPFGGRFVRLFDGVDINDPVAAATDRAVFELHAMDLPRRSA